MWTMLQGAEYVRESIAASDTYMAALDGGNSAVDQIVRAARVVLRVLVGPITTQQDLGAC